MISGGSVVRYGCGVVGDRNGCCVVCYGSAVVDGLVMTDDALGRSSVSQAQVTSAGSGQQSAQSYDLKELYLMLEI